MKKLILIYDDWCPNCTRFIKVIKKIDWLNLIIERKLRDDLSVNKIINLNIEHAKKSMASYNKKWIYGFNSIYLIVKKIPLFWLLIPLFWLLKITTLGHILYQELAVKRKIIPLHCDKDSCEIDI